MLAALSTFWLLDDTGPRYLLSVAALFFSGLTVPLVLFPGALRDLAMALPWASFIQVPADIWLGQRAGPRGGRPGSRSWLRGRWCCCSPAAAGAPRCAERRVVVQGG